jgi:hypothetical protein
VEFSPSSARVVEDTGARTFEISTSYAVSDMMRALLSCSQSESADTLLQTSCGINSSLPPRNNKLLSPSNIVVHTREQQNGEKYQSGIIHRRGGKWQTRRQSHERDQERGVTNPIDVDEQLPFAQVPSAE